MQILWILLTQYSVVYFTASIITANLLFNIKLLCNLQKIQHVIIHVWHCNTVIPVIIQRKFTFSILTRSISSTQQTSFGISCSLKPQSWGTMLTWQWSRRQSLTPSTKRVSHRGSLLKGVAVQGVLFLSILNAKLTEKRKLGREMCTSNRDDHKLENTVKQSRFRHLGELHKEWTEAGVIASRVTRSSGQPTVQRPGSSHGLPAGVGIQTHNLGLPWVSSPTLYPLGQWGMCSPLLLFQRTSNTRNLYCMDDHLLKLKCKYSNILRY